MPDVKIEMSFKDSLPTVAGIAGLTRIAFKGIPTDWFDQYQPWIIIPVSL
jgi:hypothetical protein